MGRIGHVERAARAFGAAVVVFALTTVVTACGDDSQLTVPTAPAVPTLVVRRVEPAPSLPTPPSSPSPSPSPSSSSSAPSTVAATRPVASSRPATNSTRAPDVVVTLPPTTVDPDESLMPDVVCMDLQLAQDTIQAAGVFFSRSHDATGKGRRQIIDRHWIVVAQSPAPGTPIGEFDAVLDVVKDGEPNDCATGDR